VDQKKQFELIEQLAEICEELGWVVGLPAEEGHDQTVPGLIIGREKFVLEVVAAYTDDYTLMSKDKGTDGMHEVHPAIESKKKLTFH
jgi:hypothetical protein